MKRVIKNNIFGFIVGAVIFGCLGVIAANAINARDIVYRDTNVESAIDNLYQQVVTSNNLNYDILYSKDQTTPIDISYTIKETDTEYKSIMVIVEANNISVSYSPAYITIVNDNIIPISNPDEIASVEYSNYNLTSDIYIGYINNIVKDDVVRVKGSYQVRMAILGIK